MIRIILLTLSLSLLVSKGICQLFYSVTVVEGEVYHKNGPRVEEGTALPFNETVVFKSKDAYLILLHPTQGRFIVSPSEEKKPSKLDLLISESLHLHAKNIILFSRGDAVLNIRDYFSTDTAINNKILICDSLKLAVNSSEFGHVDNTQNFFFIQLMDSGAKVYNHKLTVVKDSLLLSPSDFFFNNKLYSSQDGTISLGFAKNYLTNRDVKFISTFSPSFISQEKVRSMITTVKKCLKGDQMAVINEVYTEIYLLYGKLDKEVIRQMY